MRYWSVVCVLMVCVVFHVTAYIQYVPPVMAAVNWCNLNPHNCVRTLTNGWQNILDTVDHKVEEVRKQAMFESMFQEQRRQMNLLGGSIPTDPWKPMQLIY